MGVYINPPNRTKEAFLANEMTLHVSEREYKQFDFKAKDFLPVCLVNNGEFTAAAVAYNAEERDGFLPTYDDQRPRQYYVVPLAALLDTSKSGIEPAHLLKFMDT